MEIENITIENDAEISVELVFRCYVSERMAFYPMTVNTSIYSGFDLNSAIKDAKEEYEKDYYKVEFVTFRKE